MSVPMSKISRRGLLAAGSAFSLLSAVPGMSSSEQRKKRRIRFAFATDPHVQPERKGGEGWAACLKHIQSQKDRPEMLVTGGDLIMDALGATPERTQEQWDLFQKVTQENLKLPVHHTVGNHDVFGWSNGDKYASDKRFGKVWACSALGLDKPYYSFDRGGWHFIVLDSIMRSGNGYIGKLDEDQFAWLEKDLASVPKKTHIVVVSHIPILMVCSLFDGQNEKSGQWVVPGSYMHVDARRLVDLFLKYPNVKLCLSGHEHQIDNIVYNGVTYVCGGAVCAGWWGGNYFQCTYGYNMVDLFEGGTFNVEYVPYGWKTAQ